MDNRILYLFVTQAISWISADLPAGFTIEAKAPNELEVSWTTPGEGDVPAEFRLKFLGKFCNQDTSPCGPFNSEKGGEAVTVSMKVGRLLYREDVYTGIAAFEVTLLRVEDSESTLNLTVIDDTNSDDVAYALDDDTTLTKNSPHEITGLTARTEYTYVVTASVGGQNKSLTIKEYTGLLPSPTDLVEDTDNTNANKLGVTWTAPDDDTLTGYIIIVAGSDTDSEPETLIKNKTSYIRAGLTPVSEYTVTLVAVYDDENPDLKSYEASVTITTHQAPPSPMEFAKDMNNTKHDKLGVTWSEPSDDSFTEYSITVSGPNTNSEPETLNKMETSYIREGLTPASVYTVTLVAVYDDESSDEETLTITTLNDPNANNGSPSTYVSYKQICGWMAVFLCLYGSLLEG